jgi:hypothetical protein
MNMVEVATAYYLSNIVPTQTELPKAEASELRTLLAYLSEALGALMPDG